RSHRRVREHAVGRDRGLASAGPIVCARRERTMRPDRGVRRRGRTATRTHPTLLRNLKMAFLSMRHDFRAPAFAPESSKEIYATALEQFAWADEHGFDSLVLSEHHGVDDGWMPAPLTMAAAVLARTARARLMISAAILPLHDPIRVAEQIAVLDNAFPGRMWVVFGAGYRVEEFDMARLEHAARGRILEEHVVAVLEALSGASFEWRGRTVSVTPAPVTDPRRMRFVGGGVTCVAPRAALLRRLVVS